MNIKETLIRTNDENLMEDPGTILFALH